MAIKMHSSVPVFLVADVAATAKWYRDRLGFQFDHFAAQEPYAWAGLQLGDAELFVLSLEGHKHQSAFRARAAGGWDAYFRMTGLLAFFEAIRAGVKVLCPPTRRPYGLTEFIIEDPNEYALGFSEQIPADMPQAPAATEA